MKNLTLFIAVVYLISWGSSLFAQSPPPAPTNGQLVVQMKQSGPFWSYGVTPVANQVLGWDGTKVVMTPGGGGGGVWGTITGTLSNQTDLQAALNALQPKAGVLALGGFSSITGTLPAANVADLSGTYLTLSAAALTYQPLDADLTALAALTGTNTIYYRSGASTWSPVTIGAGLSFTGGSLAATNSGSVTSVALALPASVFTVSGSPVTSTGTLTGTLNTQDANTVFAGPTSGGAAQPTFRALTPTDVGLGATLTFGAHLVGGSYDGTVDVTIDTDADSANTAGVIVARDGSGNFAAGTISAALLGNATTATTLQTGRTIAITGDLTYTSPVFNGAGNVTAAGTLATVNANVGTFGSSSLIPVVTVNAKGLITAISTTAFSFAIGTTITGTAGSSGEVLVRTTGGTLAAMNTSPNMRTFLGAGSFSVMKQQLSLDLVENTALSTWAGSTNLTNAGTLTTGVWQATPIANAYLANSSITIGGASTSLGGTVTASTILDSVGSTRGSILYRGASGWGILTPGTSGHALVSNGAGADPTWQAAAGGTITINSTVTSGAANGDILTSDGSTVQKLTPASGVSTFLSTPSSTNLAAAVTDETGTGKVVFGTTPSFTTSIIVNKSGNTEFGGLEAADDMVSPSVRALYVLPPDYGGRVFFGKPSQLVFYLNFSNVSQFEDVPGFYTRSGFYVGGSVDMSITRGSGGTEISANHPTGYGLDIFQDNSFNNPTIAHRAFNVAKTEGATVFGISTSRTSYEGLSSRWNSADSRFEITPVAGSGGGTVRNTRYYLNSTAWVSPGSGSPEAVETAGIGSIYARTDGGVGMAVYVKESGTGNTGWAPVFTVTKTITPPGTTGAQTINKTSGSVNFAAADTSLVVTNSLCTVDSIIICTVGTNDATMKSVQVVAGSGSFTIYAGTAPTAETRVNFIITN